MGFKFRFPAGRKCPENSCCKQEGNCCVCTDGIAPKQTLVRLPALVAASPPAPSYAACFCPDLAADYVLDLGVNGLGLSTGSPCGFNMGVCGIEAESCNWGGAFTLCGEPLGISLRVGAPADNPWGITPDEEIVLEVQFCGGLVSWYQVGYLHGQGGFPDLGIFDCTTWNALKLPFTSSLIFSPPCTGPFNQSCCGYTGPTPPPAYVWAL